MTMKAGMLHTVEALQKPLEHAATVLYPELQLDHRVDASLLARAIAGADTEALVDSVRPHIEALLETGAEAVLVSCSSLGEATDSLAAQYSAPVLRIDRPMARRAVELGSRILVLATLRSTLTPTTTLVRSEATARSVEPHVTPVLVPGAAEAKAAGDTATHDRLIREAARSHVSDVDVVVLAQASMAQAFGQDISHMPVPVLSSPEPGVQAFVDVLRRRHVPSQSPGGPTHD